MIKTVVFDMDGVLFDTERIYKIAAIRAAEEYNIPNMAETSNDCTGMNIPDQKKLYEERYPDCISYEEFIIHRDRHYNELIKDGVPEKPSVHEMLDFLKREGIKIALATSTYRELATMHLRLADIEKYFDVIITGDMVKRGKPMPDIYETATRLAGGNPEETMAIEDSFNGIRSAYGAGLKTVMVPDLFMPTEEIEKMLFSLCPTLFEVIDLIKKENGI